MTCLLVGCSNPKVVTPPPNEPPNEQPDNPPNNPPSEQPASNLGIFLLHFDPQNNTAVNEAENNNLTFEAVSIKNVYDGATKVNHMTATVRVKNNTKTTINAPVFTPVVLTGTYSTVGDTAFKSVKSIDGTVLDDLSQRLTPEISHDVINGKIEINSEATPLTDYLLVHDLELQTPTSTKVRRISRRGWQGKTMAPGESQLINFAVRGPLSRTTAPDPQKDPFSFTMAFTILNDIKSEDELKYCPDKLKGECRPYTSDSPWNTRIRTDTELNPKSSEYIQAIADNNKDLTIDPDQYTIPVYLFNDSTPRVTVKLSGYFSRYTDDFTRVGAGFAPTIKDIPMPPEAVAGAGTDGQITLWNPASGEEYSFFQFGRDTTGNYTATNGWVARTNVEAQGRFANGLSGRGAGTPYLAGLIRPWEMAQGRIEHALSFAYSSPSPKFVYPASKSDGRGDIEIDVPEGSRIQLDPKYSEADFKAWGLNNEAIIIAKALQEYGMYVIDNSGSSKVYAEYNSTAKWGASITRDMLKGIPWNAFRVIAN